MLKYLLFKSTFGLSSVFFILPLFLCHTAVHKNDHFEFQSRLNASSLRPLNISLNKREYDKPLNVDVISQTPNPTVAENNITETANKTLSILIPPNSNSRSNSTLSSPGWFNAIKSGALERTGFVVLGFMSIILVFFVVRGIRLRHKKSKSRKYGIITSTDMEMEPLDNDDDDEEDTTLFDAQHKYSLP